MDTFNNQTWKYQLNTNQGELLVANDSNFVNTIYLDKKQINSLFFANSSLHLTYSYNFINLKSNDYHEKVNIANFNNLIVNVLENIADENKQFIYQRIFNQATSYEWSIDKLKTIITSFFASIRPDKYLIVDENIHQNFTIETLAENLNKSIIKLPTDIYRQLNNEEHIPSLGDWWGSFKLTYLKNYVVVYQLKSHEEQTNYEYLNQFISNIIDSNKRIKSLLVSLNICIIANLPIPVLYIPEDKTVYINEGNLTNKLETAMNIFIALFYEKLQELYTTEQYGMFWKAAINLQPLEENFFTNQAHNKDQINDNESTDFSDNAQQTAINEEDNQTNDNEEVIEDWISLIFFKLIDKVSNEYSLDHSLIINLLRNSISTILNQQYPSCKINVQIDDENHTVIANKLVTVVSDIDYENANDKDNKVSWSEVKDEIVDVKIGDFINEEIDLNNKELLKQIAQLFVNNAEQATSKGKIQQVDDLIGTVVDGTVEAIDLDKGITYVTFNGMKGKIFDNQEIKNEELINGHIYKFYVEDKDYSNQAYPYNLSRNNKELVLQLFKQKVPEIQQGIVQIINAVRNPGDETKILVTSNDANINPVTACCGENRSILHAIEELIFIPDDSSTTKPEYINIIPFSDNPINLIANACKPIKIIGVGIINETNKRVYVIAHQKNIPALIGTKGTNVKLIGQLTGWWMKVMNQDEAYENGIDYTPIDARHESNNNYQSNNNDELIDSNSLNTDNNDTFENNDDYHTSSSENYSQFDRDDNVENEENDKVITDFSQLSEFADLTKEINQWTKDESATKISSNQDQINNLASLESKDFTQPTDFEVTNNEQVLQGQVNANQQENNLQVTSTNNDDDDEIIHFDQPLFAINKFIQVYHGTDEKVNEEVPFYLQWLVDSWPWKFTDEEFRKLDFGNVSLTFAFFNEGSIIFSITCKNWTSFNPKITSCHLLNKEVSAAEWKTTIEKWNNQSVNLNYWNDLLFIIITSLQAIEKYSQSNSSPNKNQVKLFHPSCQITIGNYISAMVDYQGIAHQYQLGKGELHLINSWNDLLLSMLNIACIPISQIPFNNKYLSYFLQPFDQDNQLKIGWMTISDNQNICYSKLESNWMKILIRAIVFLTFFNKCDFK